MKVMKFGGTSVGKPERMKQVSELITADNEAKIVVLSALSGTTNALVAIGNRLSEGDKAGAKQLIDELEDHYRIFIEQLVKSEPQKEKASAIVTEHFEFLNIILRISFSEALNKDILAQGELLSTKLFCVFLEELGINHAWLPALDFMVIDEHNEPAMKVISERLKSILSKHSGQKLFVTQGYICRNARGEVDNLKRGGSDYSASLIAAAVQAKVCEIWTDISGMHNNDPREVSKTIPIEQLSFDEAAELAYFGAKILHPASIWPAQQANIPVKLLNTMEPSAAGTTISGKASQKGPRAIAAKDGITAINIRSSRMLLAYGFLRKIFEVFEYYRTPIDMITTSEVAVSVTIDNNQNLPAILEALKKLGSVESEEGLSIISIVGSELLQRPNVLRELFSSLDEVPMRMISYGGSKHNVSVLVSSTDKKKTLELLNNGLFKL